jgi:predicted transglutaminase-like cysteine proteinase
MRASVKMLTTLAAVSGILWHQAAEAAFFGYSRPLGAQVERLQLAAPALAPMAHARFCIQYPEDCKVRRMAFRRNRVALTPKLWAELTKVNTEVNRRIVPERNDQGLAGEKWLVSPVRGDCNDYAVTKRHELLARGWPSRALLLAEVVVPSGEHHLVLVVHTNEGDFLADNLNANIRPWFQARYRWVRVQSPRNPLFWAMVATREREAAARRVSSL